MNQYQKNRLNMMNLVITVCDKNLAVISAIVEFLSSYTSFKNIVTLINDTLKEQIIELKGIAEVKKSLKNALALSSVKVAAAIKAYAHKNKMFDLEQEMNFTGRKLSKFNDLYIQKIAGHILDVATLHAADIVAFGIKADDITTLTKDLDAFSKRYNDPTIAIELRKHHTKKIDELMAQASDILKNEMDAFIIVVESTNPDFHSIYKNSRNIIDRHGKTRETKVAEGIGTVYVTAAATMDASPLEDVKADLKQNGEVIDTVYTDENGEATFDNVKEGTYIIELNQETFNPKQSEEFAVVPGDELSFDLFLDASLE